MVDATNKQRRVAIKKVSLDYMGQGCWGNSERNTRAQLIVDHAQHIIALRKTSGPDPHIDAVLSLLANDKDCILEYKYAYRWNQDKRKYGHKVETYYGESGCEEYKLYSLHPFKNQFRGTHREAAQYLSYLDPLVKKEAASMRISCGNSVGNLCYFVPDLFLLLWADDFYHWTWDWKLYTDPTHGTRYYKYLECHYNVQEEVRNGLNCTFILDDDRL